MTRHLSEDSEEISEMNLNTHIRDSFKPRQWLRNNAKVLFIAVLLVSLVTLVGASIQMLQIAFESQPGCVAHSQSKNDASISHRAAKSAC